MPPHQVQNNPYSQTPAKSRGHALLIPLVVLALLLLVALGFGAWAYMERQDYKNNVDSKIKDAVAVAVQQESSRKDNEFLEKEKSPYKSYKGPDTFGTVSIKYPKTWSAYVIEKSSSTTPISGYFHSPYVPDVQGQTAFALRLEVINRAYDQELKTLDSKAKSGKVRISAYKAKNVSGVTGVRIVGEIDNGKTSTMVLLPLRDKTLKIWTESTTFVKDLDSIILATLTFTP